MNKEKEENKEPDDIWFAREGCSLISIPVES